MSFNITNRNDLYTLRVYNIGYLVSIHNSHNKNYIKRLIRKYSEWVTHPKAACYGKEVQEDWNV